MSVTRFDRGKILKATKTPQGGMRIDAAIARTGLQTYRNPDGTERVEYRPASEVFHPDSLASYQDAPVTDGHHGLITPANYSQFTKGHSKEARQDGEVVAAPLIIQDGDLLSKIDSGDRKDLSNGYTCDLEIVSGTHEGQRYDAIQRNIRTNHIAVLPPGTGRAGAVATLRLDGNEDEAEPESEPTKAKEINMKTIRLDGKDYEFGSDAHLEKVEQMHRAALAIETTAKLEAIGRADSLDVDLKKTKALLEEATSPAAVQTRVDARLSIESKAKTLLPSIKCDGKTDVEIMTEVVKADDKDFDGAKAVVLGEGYLRGRFESIKTPVREDSKLSPLDAARGNLFVAPDTTRVDAKDEIDAEASMRKMREDSRNSHKSWSGMSKDKD